MDIVHIIIVIYYYCQQINLEIEALSQDEPPVYYKIVAVVVGSPQMNQSDWRHIITLFQLL